MNDTFVEAARQLGTCKQIERDTGVVLDEVDLYMILQICRDDRLIPAVE